MEFDGLSVSFTGHFVFSFSGETFYKHLLKYVMTEEQLGENGYPCPDPEEKGKAVVQKVITFSLG